MAVKSKGPKLYFSQYGGEQPIPSEFLAAMNRREEIQAVPEDVEPEALSDLIVESKVETNRTNERVRKTVKKDAGNIVLRDIRTNDAGQPIQVTRTLFPTVTAPTPPTATTNVAIKDLGNGWSIQEVGVEGTYVGNVFTPGIFSGSLFRKELPNVTPVEFRPSIPTVTTREDSAGTAVAPALTGDEFSETQEQVTEFKKRVTIETQANPELPISLTEYDTTNDKLLATVVKTLETVGGAPTAPGLHTSVQVNNLGDGRQVRRVSTSAAFVDQPGQAYDRRLDIVPSTFVDTTVALGTDIGDARISIDPQDFTKARNRTFAPNTTALEGFVKTYAETADITQDLPRVLLSVAVTWDTNSGNGAYHEIADGAASGTTAQLGFTMNGSGQSSASVIANIEPQWKVFFGKNFPVLDYFFLLPSPLSHAGVQAKLEAVTGGTVNWWPRFALDQPTFTLVGKKISFSAKATASFSVSLGSSTSSYSGSAGIGIDYDFGTTMRSVTLPECIHGIVTLTPATLDASASTQASCATPTGENFPGAAADTGLITETVTGAITPDSLAATTLTDWPASGLYIKEIRSEDYELGYVLVRARVADFSLL